MIRLIQNFRAVRIWVDISGLNIACLSTWLEKESTYQWIKKHCPQAYPSVPYAHWYRGLHSFFYLHSAFSSTPTASISSYNFDFRPLYNSNLLCFTSNYNEQIFSQAMSFNLTHIFFLPQYTCPYLKHHNRKGSSIFMNINSVCCSLVCVMCLF